MFLFLERICSRMSEYKSICATLFRCMSLHLPALKYIMFSESNAHAINVCACVWRSECRVINLGVITIFVSLWGLFSPLIHLFIPASFSLHHSDLLHRGSPKQLAEAVKQRTARAVKQRTMLTLHAGENRKSRNQKVLHYTQKATPQCTHWGFTWGSLTKARLYIQGYEIWMLGALHSGMQCSSIYTIAWNPKRFL